jgi:hypothetical protein
VNIVKVRCSWDENDRPRAPCPNFKGIASAGRFCMNDCPYFHSFDKSNPLADFVKCGFPDDMRGPDFKPIRNKAEVEGRKG